MSISVNVQLISGRAVALEARADETCQEVSLRAQGALGVGKGRLLTSSGETLDGAATVKRAGLKDCDVLTLHVGQTRVAVSGICVGREANSSSSACAAVLGDDRW